MAAKIDLLERGREMLFKLCSANIERALAKVRASNTLLLLERIFLSFHNWYGDDKIDSDGFSRMLLAPFKLDIIDEIDIF